MLHRGRRHPIAPMFEWGRRNCWDGLPLLENLPFLVFKLKVFLGSEAQIVAAEAQILSAITVFRVGHSLQSFAESRPALSRVTPAGLVFFKGEPD